MGNRVRSSSRWPRKAPLSPGSWTPLPPRSRSRSSTAFRSRFCVEKFAHTRFEPSGWTGNEQIGFAKSIMDYIFRWLQLRFLSGHQLSLFSGLAAGAQPTAAPGLAADRGRRTAAFRARNRKLRNQAAGQRHRARSWRCRARAGASCVQLQHGRPGNLRSARNPQGWRGNLSRGRRHEGVSRHGRRAQLPYLRRHHGPQR